MSQPFDLSQLPETSSLPYPADTKQVAGCVNGVPTDVMNLSFSDKILIVVSQKGRLSHWVCLCVREISHYFSLVVL